MEENKPLEKEEGKTTTKKSTKKSASKAKAKKKTTKVKPKAKKVAKKSEKKESVAEQVVSEIPKPASKPVAFTQQASQKSSSKKKGSSGALVFLFIVVILGLLIAGAVFQSKKLQLDSQEVANNLRQDVNSEVNALKSKLDQLTQELAEQKEEKKEPELMTYSNELLGISFQYDPVLGDIVEESTSNPTPEASEEAQSQMLALTFTANPDLSFVFVTTDYVDEKGIAYLGDQEDVTTLCQDPLAVNETGYCDLANFGGAAVEFVKVLKDGTGDVNQVIMQSIQNTSQTYQGMSLILNLGLPPVTTRNLFAPTENEDSNQATITYLGNILKGENLSLITSQNIKHYRTIRDSMSFSSN